LNIRTVSLLAQQWIFFTCHILFGFNLNECDNGQPVGAGWTAKDIVDTVIILKAFITPVRALGLMPSRRAHKNLRAAVSFSAAACVAYGHVRDGQRPVCFASSLGMFRWRKPQANPVATVSAMACVAHGHGQCPGRTADESARSGGAP
jgi:hypothetical protein